MKLLVGLVLLLALLVGVDRVGVRLAEDQLAQQVSARSAGLAADPEADVRGFPFLTQVLAGTYPDVRVRGELADGPVPVQELELRLTDLQVGLGDLLGGSVDQVPVEGLSATGLLLWDDLEAVADLPVELSLEGEDQVRVNGQVDLLGQVVAADAVSSAAVVDGQLLLSTTSLSLGGQAPDEAVAGQLRGQLDVRLPVPALPYGLVLEDVTPSARGLVLTARGGPTVLG